MSLDNTKTITAVTYNGNDWPVGGGGGGINKITDFRIRSGRSDIIISVPNDFQPYSHYCGVFKANLLSRGEDYGVRCSFGLDKNEDGTHYRYAFIQFLDTLTDKIFACETLPGIGSLYIIVDNLPITFDEGDIDDIMDQFLYYG